MLAPSSRQEGASMKICIIVTICRRTVARGGRIKSWRDYDLPTGDAFECKGGSEKICDF